MEHRVTATELARSLGEILGRVRFRNDTFVVERNGEAVARLEPLASASTTTLAEAFRAWTEAGPADPGFADDLERVGALDLTPADPWAS